MNRKMSRTFIKNTVKVVEMYSEEGQPKQRELPDLILTGTLNREQIEKAVRKEYKGKTVLVLSTKQEEETFTLPVSKFIEAAIAYEKEQEVLKKQKEQEKVEKEDVK